MIRALILAAVLVLAAGCSLPNRVIITSGNMSGGVGTMFVGDRDSCTISTEGNIKGVTIEYTDEKCNVLYER